MIMKSKSFSKFVASLFLLMLPACFPENDHYQEIDCDVLTPVCSMNVYILNEKISGMYPLLKGELHGDLTQQLLVFVEAENGSACSLDLFHEDFAAVYNPLQRHTMSINFFCDNPLSIIIRNASNRPMFGDSIISYLSLDQCILHWRDIEKIASHFNVLLMKIEVNDFSFNDNDGYTDCRDGGEKRNNTLNQVMRIDDHHSALQKIRMITIAGLNCSAAMNEILKYHWAHLEALKLNCGVAMFGTPITSSMPELENAALVRVDLNPYLYNIMIRPALEEANMTRSDLIPRLISASGNCPLSECVIEWAYNGGNSSVHTNFVSLKQDGKKLPSNVLMLNLHSVGEKKCLLRYDFPFINRIKKRNEFQFWIVQMVCSGNFQVILPDLPVVGETVASILEIQSCFISWSDLDKLSISLNAKMLILDADAFPPNVNASDCASEDEIQAGSSSSKSLQMTSTLFSFSIQGHRCNEAMKVIKEHKWTSLVTFRAHCIDIELGDMQSIMPNLEAIILIGGQTSMVTFPWPSSKADHVKFPYNVTIPSIMAKSKYIDDLLSESLDLGLRFDEVPKTLRLQEQNLGNISEVKLAGHLDILDLQACNIVEINQDFITAVTGLTFLALDDNTLLTIPDKLFSTSKEIICISFSKNSISKLLKDTFSDLPVVQYINLSFNRITHFEQGSFHNLPHLKYLFLNSNELKTVNFINLDTSWLLKLDLSDNDLQMYPLSLLREDNSFTVNISGNDLCIDDIIHSRDTIDKEYINGMFYRIPWRSSYRQHIKYLNNWSTPCQINLRFTPPLSTNNEVRNEHDQYRYTLREIKKSIWDNKDLENVDLSNPLHKFTLLSANLEYDFRDGPLVCDCNLGKLNLYYETVMGMHYAADHFKFADGVCNEPIHLRGRLVGSLQDDELYCLDESSTSKCPDECQCFIDFTGAYLVNCSYADLSEFPEEIPPSTKFLHLEHNNISEANFTREYIKDLRALYLDNNRITSLTYGISQMSPNSILTLHENNIIEMPREIEELHESVNISLHKNDFICSCDSLWFKDWIANHVTQIWNVHLITCLPDQPDREVNQSSVVTYVLSEESDFCLDARWKQLLIGLFTCLPLLIIVSSITIYWRYTKLTRPIYTEDIELHEEVKNLLFDVMLSYADEDEEFVHAQLRYYLEMQHPGINVCDHMEHFMPGNYIIENIQLALSQSQCVLIVLSDSYAASEWCQYEFAEARRLRKKVLIVLMIDEANLKNLPELFKTYIKTRTYLHVSAEKFWDRLSDALRVQKA